MPLLLGHNHIEREDSRRFNASWSTHSFWGRDPVAITLREVYTMCRM